MTRRQARKLERNIPGYMAWAFAALLLATLIFMGAQ